MKTNRLNAPWYLIAVLVIGILWIRNWKVIPKGRVPYGARVEYAMQATEGPSHMYKVTC